ncbi:MAG: T9SS type A sorting domain-containing protein, partial [Eudoraea sp.]|nr:T9SS type A sorting domain-containing protein [Eudoraea sp.]
NTQTQVVYLLGYSPLLQPFLFRLDNLATPFNLTAGGEKFNLNIGFAQMEAICVLDENRYYLSSEAFSSSNPPLSLNTTLFTLTTEDRESDPPPEEENDEDKGESELSIFIPFGTKSLEYTLETDQEIIGWEIFDLSGRRIDYLGKGDILENPIDISALNSAIYYLAFYLNGNTIAKPFFID